MFREKSLTKLLNIEGRRAVEHLEMMRISANSKSQARALMAVAASIHAATEIGPELYQCRRWPVTAEWKGRSLQACALLRTLSGAIASSMLRTRVDIPQTQVIEGLINGLGGTESVRLMLEEFEHQLSHDDEPRDGLAQLCMFHITSSLAGVESGGRWGRPGSPAVPATAAPNPTSICLMVRAANVLDLKPEEYMPKGRDGATFMPALISLLAAADRIGGQKFDWFVQKGEIWW